MPLSAMSDRQPMTSTVAKTLVWLAVLGIFLFVPAGTLAWPLGWAAMGSYGAIVVVAFAVVDLDLLRERARPGPGVERSDAVLASVGGLLLYPATLAVAGFDYSAQLGPRVPLAASLAGLAVFVLGYLFALWAMHTNRYFATFVRIQHDRGHRVIDRGPYAVVRHPGYTGTLVAHLALPIALGSVAALVPAVFACVVFAIRTANEDRLLTEKLEGYEAYRSRVRWRLLPGVW